MKANLDTIALGSGGQQKRQHRSRNDTRLAPGGAPTAPGTEAPVACAVDESLVDCAEDMRVEWAIVAGSAGVGEAD